jgi:hypothetical protein
LIFRAKDKKDGYKPGLFACLGCACFNVLIVCCLSIKFMRDNKKAREGKKLIEGSEVRTLSFRVYSIVDGTNIRWPGGVPVYHMRRQMPPQETSAWFA